MSNFQLRECSRICNKMSSRVTWIFSLILLMCMYYEPTKSKALLSRLKYRTKRAASPHRLGMIGVIDVNHLSFKVQSKLHE